MALRTVTLKFIARNADFRQNEQTLWDTAKQKHKLTLGKNECALFISRSGNQAVFIVRTSEIQGKRNVYSVTESRRWRLSGGTWSDDMLEDYANAVGLHLAGFETFEQKFTKARLAKMLGK